MSPFWELRGSVRFVVAFVSATITFSLAATAHAEVPDDLFIGRIGAIEELLERGHEEDNACEERCYALESLQISGDARSGSLEFELRGSLMTTEPTVIPLFGPPERVLLEDVVASGGGQSDSRPQNQLR